MSNYEIYECCNNKSCNHFDSSYNDKCIIYKDLYDCENFIKSKTLLYRCLNKKCVFACYGHISKCRKHYSYKIKLIYK